MGNFVPSSEIRSTRPSLWCIHWRLLATALEEDQLTLIPCTVGVSLFFLTYLIFRWRAGLNLAIQITSADVYLFFVLILGSYNLVFQRYLSILRETPLLYRKRIFNLSYSRRQKMFFK